jgi:hypothetical protein
MQETSGIVQDIWKCAGVQRAVQNCKLYEVVRLQETCGIVQNICKCAGVQNCRFAGNFARFDMASIDVYLYRHICIDHIYPFRYISTCILLIFTGNERLLDDLRLEDGRRQ